MNQNIYMASTDLESASVQLDAVIALMKIYPMAKLGISETDTQRTDATESELQAAAFVILDLLNAVRDTVYSRARLIHAENAGAKNQ